MVAQGLPQLLESHGMAREMLEDGLGRFFVIRVRGQVPVVDHLDPAWIVRNEPLLKRFPQAPLWGPAIEAFLAQAALNGFPRQLKRELKSLDGRVADNGGLRFSQRFLEAPERLREGVDRLVRVHYPSFTA